MMTSWCYDVHARLRPCGAVPPGAGPAVGLGPTERDARQSVRIQRRSLSVFVSTGSGEDRMLRRLYYLVVGINARLGFPTFPHLMVSERRVSMRERMIQK